MRNVMRSTSTGGTRAALIADRRGLSVMRMILILLMIAAAAAMGGCANSRGGPIPYDVALGAPDAPASATLEENYQISPLDTLKVDVFRVPDLSGDYQVDLTGHFSMPLIGSVRAVDKTPAQLRAHLVEQLSAKYLQSPDVSVGIKSSTRRNVTVDGSVRQPGQYPVTGPMTLIQVIAMARGTDSEANPRRTAIFRQVGGKRMAAAFDLTSIRRGEMPDPAIYSGDIIVVDGSTVNQAKRELLQTIPLLGLFNPLLL